MSGLSRTPGKRVYGESRTAGSNPALSASTDHGLMTKDLKAVVGNVVQSNLAVLGAFIAVSSALPPDQQEELLKSLDTMRKANQALLEMLNEPKH